MQVLKLLKQIQLEERGEVEPPPIALPVAEDLDEDEGDEDDDEDEDDDSDEGAQPACHSRIHLRDCNRVSAVLCNCRGLPLLIYLSGPLTTFLTPLLANCASPCADEEAEGFFDEEEQEAPSSPSRRRSGLSMAAMEQRDSSFFGFEDPGGAFADDDDVPWQSDEELQCGSTAAGSDVDGLLGDPPADDGSASGRGEKGSRRWAGTTSGSRRW